MGVEKEMKLIVGAGEKVQEGWISTEQGQLDLLHPEDFECLLNGLIGFEAILAEHPDWQAFDADDGTGAILCGPPGIANPNHRVDDAW